MTRAERRARTEAVKTRRYKTLKAVDPHAPPATPDFLGPMRWKSPMDCGVPECGVCHPSKRWASGSRRAAGRRKVRAEEKAGG